MQSLLMKYHYQARTHAIATCELKADWIEEHVLTPLHANDRVSVDAVSEVFDISGNHLCTGTITWQIKEWGKVKPRTL